MRVIQWLARIVIVFPVNLIMLLICQVVQLLVCQVPFVVKLSATTAWKMSESITPGGPTDQIFQLPNPEQLFGVDNEDRD